MKLKLLCLNIEGHKHFEIVKDFFKKEAPDVLCIQEVFEEDFEDLKSYLGMEGVFAPMSAHRHYFSESDETWRKRGVAILSRIPMHEIRPEYYWGSQAVSNFDKNTMTQDDMSKVLLYCEVGEEKLSIATTHFTWTPDSLPNDFQWRHFKKLLPVLEAHKELVLCGDFNAPRGGEIFGKLSELYRDNIPAEYITSLDPNLHRAPKDLRDSLMVDGLFSTPGIRVSDVKMVDGVSDHKAIIAVVENK